ncbi:hypothetical protein J0895_04920 [Phormidium pseudopriestleyi FRX01]|uniref:Uncharacterized protein n=1 Tax=Phormidium pseudopriestleyi FRX01 TaxID=1759528 RepID=A0ABS3FMX0_9CYAN|nr:hypothetical protein [Phormidium pseudopriestleyi]MBO0348456.1 hypothetical protein [Phormidium pseudopriestleyi FRX01]
MKKNFGELIWSSFLEIQGVLIGFIGILITIILSRLPVKTQIPLDLVIAIALFMLLLVVTLIKASYQSFKTAQELSQLQKSVIPKILYVSKEPSSQAPFQLRCLLGNSALFSNDTCISFYYTDDEGFERLIGMGVVLTVQDNGKVQALLDIPLLGYQEILEKLGNNDLKIIGQTIVKSNITRKMMLDYLFNLE